MEAGQETAVAEGEAEAVELAEKETDCEVVALELAVLEELLVF